MAAVASSLFGSLAMTTDVVESDWPAGADGNIRATGPGASGIVSVSERMIATSEIQGQSESVGGTSAAGRSNTLT
ncbi:hypothetical protein ASE86_14440 [Sphingomonas sp. Leaf33]|nr:hypothetical protein ASE86_14440 [Sphingomonas sp. Leaf33]